MSCHLNHWEWVMMPITGLRLHFGRWFHRQQQSERGNWYLTRNSSSHSCTLSWRINCHCFWESMSLEVWWWRRWWGKPKHWWKCTLLSWQSTFSISCILDKLHFLETSKPLLTSTQSWSVFQVSWSQSTMTTLFQWLILLLPPVFLNFQRREYRSSYRKLPTRQSKIIMGYSVKYLSCVKVTLIMMNLLLFVSIPWLLTAMFIDQLKMLF